MNNKLKATTEQVILQSNSPEQVAFACTLKDLVESYVWDLENSEVTDDPTIVKHKFYKQLYEEVAKYDYFRTLQIEELKAKLIEEMTWSVRPMQVLTVEK